MVKDCGFCPCFFLFQLWNSCHEPDDVRGSVQESLDNLGLDCLDLYLIHWPISFKVRPDCTRTVT